MATTYRKTTRGADEVQTRARRLAPRLRQVLIIVDGRKTDAELGALLPQAAECLAALLQDGLIEPVPAAAPAPAPGPARPPAAAPPPAPAPATAAGLAPASPAPTGDAPFEATRRELLRAFNDRVGPAGEQLAMRMERTRSAEELRALLPQAVQLVGTIAGRGAAAEFAERAQRV